MNRFSLITGISGQDGSYLSELLLEKGYKVWGIIRRSSLFNLSRLDSIRNNPNLTLVYGDMTDSSNLMKILNNIKKEIGGNILEIYNLAAQSHVGISFEIPEYTADATGIGVLKLLEAIKNNDMIKQVKFYQASTSEIFGGIPGTEPQNELTRFIPKSPYAVAKLYAHHILMNYKESYGLFACSGILFNHSSPRRGENFILKKIVQEVIKIKNNKDHIMFLGNLDAKRDIGYAKDYVYAMFLMLQQDKPDNYVISTGKQYTIREFVNMALELINIEIKWEGNGLNETGYIIENGVKRIIVKVSEKYFRPNEVNSLIGDSTKAYNELKWKHTLDIKQLLKLMIDNE
jgi:GDPmannose 4,6-dehydratase